MNKKNLALALSALPVAGLGIHQGALAQGAEKPVFEEVIVTAQKREQSIYDVPVAISAFSAATIEKQGVANLTDIGKFVPNLNVTEFVAKLRLAVEAADLHYWEWDAATGRVQWGRSPSFAPDDAEGTLRASIERGEPFEIEYRVTAPDGQPQWLAARGVPMLDAAGRAYRMIGVSQDISARKAREEAVRFLAYHDSLTGLPNRRLLDDRLAQAIHLAQRRDRKLAVMLIDLDDFKQVNDSLGHRAGDAVLREVAQRLALCVRKADTLARHGGDEFVVVISDVQADSDCKLVAEKVLRSLAAAFQLEGRALALAASIGISLFPTDAGDGDALLRNADAAMYRAKQLGRNQYRFYGR